ncbi:MAG: hypothetical protein N2318_09395 [Meiothermus sp.]|nr:hypothetical protein [Meiothermus sp.]
MSSVQFSPAGKLIGTILRHDAKTASYKLALIRSINDVALGFPEFMASENKSSLAVPLKLLAEFWIAYYWPFVGNVHIIQGRPQGSKQDISFRKDLSALRIYWEKNNFGFSQSDGYYLVSEMRSFRRAQTYPPDLRLLYKNAKEAVLHAIRQPIRYAGQGEWSLFPKPSHWSQLKHRTNTVALPGTQEEDLCLLIDASLWVEFLQVSLWVEALCIHEWALFTEQLTGMNRGQVYEALTSRPDNRRPLTWERNQVELLMMEGHTFVCPWTGNELNTKNYDIDHLIPVSLYPINETWNLVPADRGFNQRVKRDKLPSDQRIEKLTFRLPQCYGLYELSELREPLRVDSNNRFGDLGSQEHFRFALSQAVGRLITAMKYSRNVAEF